MGTATLLHRAVFGDAIARSARRWPFFEKGPHPKLGEESGTGGGKSNVTVISEVVIGINGKTYDNDNDRRRRRRSNII